MKIENIFLKKKIKIPERERKKEKVVTVFIPRGWSEPSLQQGDQCGSSCHNQASDSGDLVQVEELSDTCRMKAHDMTLLP